MIHKNLSPQVDCNGGTKEFIFAFFKPSLTMRARAFHMSRMKLILLLIFSVALSSCQKNMLSPPPSPASVASPQDQGKLSRALNEIQQIADDLGLGRDFRNFPIVIVDRSPGSHEVLAYCQQDENGSGIYIGILKSTMDNYINYETNGESFLFMLLVHEFGHCFYQRSHDETTLAFPGMQIYFRVHMFPPEYINVGSEIPVSAMTSTPRPEASHFLPESVKKYYLSEVAGLTRWYSRQDVEHTPGVHIGYD
jgi:hypothetical protein